MRLALEATIERSALICRSSLLAVFLAVVADQVLVKA
jgi:hypothetical protein